VTSTTTGTHRVSVFDPLLEPAEADAMVELCERFGTYTLYTTEQSAERFAPELAQRYDAAANFVRTGGRFARDEPPAALAARTNYFREEYAYGDEVRFAGIEPLLHHEGFVDAARALHGRPVIEPAIVYANILVIGQELAVHTDVPEFRGANRRTFPQWLMVVMHHSGLFDAWRMPIATGIAYFGESSGGEMAYYPEGASGPPRTHATRHNTAVLLDTDTVFHGVDRVGGPSAPAPPLRPGFTMRFEGDDTWTARDETDAVVATYPWADVRLSVSWKAYCFADDAERDAWREHRDDLSLEVSLDRLDDDLRARGRLSGEPPSDENDLGRLLIDEYSVFPPASPEESATG
jgi:hypothetical protein